MTATLERLETEEKELQQGLDKQRATLILAGLNGEVLTVAELEQVGWTRHDLAQAMIGAKQVLADLNLVAASDAASRTMAALDLELATLRNAYDEASRKLREEYIRKSEPLEHQIRGLQGAQIKGDNARVRLMERRPKAIQDRLAPLERQAASLLTERRNLDSDAAARRSHGAFEDRHHKAYIADLARIEGELKELQLQAQAIELEVFSTDATAFVV